MLILIVVGVVHRCSMLSQYQWGHFYSSAGGGRIEGRSREQEQMQMPLPREVREPYGVFGVPP